MKRYLVIVALCFSLTGCATWLIGPAVTGGTFLGKHLYDKYVVKSEAEKEAPAPKANKDE